ncbi:hypothetical protein U6B65_07305 [Oscillospiraceae bacterium MB08-C2-2]|nr:hypothetical protein U6B65_07305 [Oscillospiraceae bacterium MB08-C2-2]
MNHNPSNHADIPVGLTMALAQNLNALNKFSHMDAPQKEQFVQGAHQVNSKEEMQAYVNNLLQG